MDIQRVLFPSILLLVAIWVPPRLVLFQMALLITFLHISLGEHMCVFLFVGATGVESLGVSYVWLLWILPNYFPATRRVWASWLPRGGGWGSQELLAHVSLSSTHGNIERHLAVSHVGVIYTPEIGRLCKPGLLPLWTGASGTLANMALLHPGVSCLSFSVQPPPGRVVSMQLPSPEALGCQSCSQMTLSTSCVFLGH